MSGYMAVEEDGEFIVLEGSEALTGTGYVQRNYGGLKQKLTDDGVLAPNGVDRLRFAKPCRPASRPGSVVQ